MIENDYWCKPQCDIWTSFTFTALWANIDIEMGGGRGECGPAIPTIQFVLLGFVGCR